MVTRRARPSGGAATFDAGAVVLFAGLAAGLAAGFIVVVGEGEPCAGARCNCGCTG